RRHRHDHLGRRRRSAVREDAPPPRALADRVRVLRDPRAHADLPARAGQPAVAADSRRGRDRAGVDARAAGPRRALRAAPARAPARARARPALRPPAAAVEPARAGVPAARPLLARAAAQRLVGPQLGPGEPARLAPLAQQREERDRAAAVEAVLPVALGGPALVVVVAG